MHDLGRELAAAQNHVDNGDCLPTLGIADIRCVTMVTVGISSLWCCCHLAALGIEHMHACAINTLLVG